MPLKDDGPRITALGEMLNEREHHHPTIASYQCQALASTVMEEIGEVLEKNRACCLARKQFSEC